MAEKLKRYPVVHDRSSLTQRNIYGGKVRSPRISIFYTPKKTKNIIILVLLYIYLGLGSYRLTIIERNGGVGCKGNSRVVEKSLSRVANMNSECFSDCESDLLEGVDRWCWGRVGVPTETSCLCEFPIMVGEFEDAFWAWKVCDFVVH